MRLLHTGYESFEWPRRADQHARPSSSPTGGDPRASCGHCDRGLLADLAPAHRARPHEGGGHAGQCYNTRDTKHRHQLLESMWFGLRRQRPLCSLLWFARRLLQAGIRRRGRLPFTGRPLHLLRQALLRRDPGVVTAGVASPKRGRAARRDGECVARAASITFSAASRIVAFSLNATVCLL